MHSDKLKIALMGRTNVGKSTLYNRLTRSRDALAFDRPGVTRDARSKEFDVWNKEAIITDTPGAFDYAECENDPNLVKAVNRKIETIISNSDVIVFVIDAIAGLTTYDKEFSRTLRKSGKPVVLAVNKSEKKTTHDTFSESMELGFADVVKISAEHGDGISDLLEILHRYIPENETEDDIIIEPTEQEEVIKLAIVGRPNVGKSTIVNKILKEDKQLVADFAGLTRESASSDFEYNGRKLRLIDTPGIRRSARVTDVLEKISVSNTRKSYKHADAVILMVDASSLEGGKIEKQDLTLASDILKHGKALVIAFNKCDKTPYDINDIPEFLKRNFAISLSQLKEAPFMFVSAINEQNNEKLLDKTIATYDNQKRKIPTSKLNDWMSKISMSDLLQSGSARFKLKYITQVGSVPPTFLIFVSNRDNMRDDHERFITNNLKKSFRLEDVAVKVIFRDQTRKKK